MNKFIVVAFLLFVSISVFAEDCPVDSLWFGIYGNPSEDDFMYDIVQASDSSYIGVGSYSTGFSTMDEFYILEIDTSGNLLWQKTYGDYAYEAGMKVLPWNDNYFAVGYSQSFSTSYKGWLLKFDSVGDTIWTKLYGGSSNDLLTNLICTVDSNIILTGASRTGSAGNYDAWFVKIDSLGTILWDTLYGGTEDDEIMGICLDTDSTFIAVGYSSSSGSGSQDGLIMRLSTSTGDTLWTKYIDNGGEDELFSVIMNSDSNLVIAGWSDIASDSSEQGMLMCITNNGDSVWTEYYGGYSDDKFYGVLQDGDKYIAVGSNASLPGVKEQRWMLAADSAGDSLWSKLYGSSNVANFDIRIIDGSPGTYMTCGGDYEGSQYNAVVTRFDTLWADTFGLISPNSDYCRYFPDEFLWHSSYAKNGIDRYELVIDDTLIINTMSYDSSYLLPDTLSLGEHTWYAVAYNTYDNPRPSLQTFTYTVDYEIPAEFNILAPADNYYTNNPNVDFSWENSVDTLSGISHYILQTSYDYTFNTIVIDTFSDSTGINLLIPDTLLYWRVIAVDNVGNTKTCNQYNILEVDTTIPAITNLVAPADSMYISTGDVMFTWTSSTKASPVTYNIEIDTTSLFTAPVLTDSDISGASYHYILPFEGYFWWHVQPVDSAGNANTYSSSRALCLDITEPEIISWTVYNDTIYKGPFPITVAAEDSLAGVDSVFLHYRTPDDTLWYVSAMTNTHDDMYSDTIPQIQYAGPIYYYFTAKDRSIPGNTGTSSITTFFVLNGMGAPVDGNAYSLQIETVHFSNHIELAISGLNTELLTIGVYDVSGRQIRNLIEVSNISGSYRNSFNIPGNGIYFLKVHTDSDDFTQKLIIL